MSVEADKENFIAVCPRGTGRVNPARMPAWNSSNCGGHAQQNHVDDVGFMRALIDKLEQDYAVDPKRIYVTGISSGGMMSYRLACELSDKIATAAPLEGAQNLTGEPSSSVSIAPITSGREVRSAVTLFQPQTSCGPSSRNIPTPSSERSARPSSARLVAG